MAKQYIGSDEHWIDSVNQRYDDNERRSKEQMQEQEDNRVQCWKIYVEGLKVKFENKSEMDEFFKSCELVGVS